MTPSQFVIWLKGFTEACNDLTATPKQWDRIKEELDEIEDYDNAEIDDWKPERDTFREPFSVPYVPPVDPYKPPYWVGDPPGWMQVSRTTAGTGTETFPTSGSITILSASGSASTFTVTPGTTSITVWNDSMGNWHYTNSTLEDKNKKQQLND